MADAPKPPSSAKEPSELRKLGLFGLIVSDLIGFTGAGWWISHYVRQKKALPESIEAIGIGLGFGLALWQIWNRVKKEERRNDGSSERNL